MKNPRARTRDAHQATRKIVREARRQLQSTLGGRGAGKRRVELVAGGIIRGTLAEAVDHFVRASSRLGRRALLRELEQLRRAAAGGIGGLLWAARGAARRQLRALLEEIAGGDGTLWKEGLAAAGEGPRFRRREYSRAVSKELRSLLDDARRGGGSAAVKAYLAGLSPAARSERMRPAAKELIAVLGSEVVARLLEGGGIVLVDNVRFFVPFLSAPSRGQVLREAMSAQRELGDETSIVALFMCAPWMNVAETAEAFASFFSAFGSLDPTNHLYNLIRRNGDIYWSAPLLRKLGGDEALVATGREIVDAAQRAEQRARGRRR